ncbi:tetratricopeptide repeat protein [Pseudomonas sp. BLCC-B13]|uniref:tetratricopeptide repeat protein n=1 Tax=Pseudomonas sp. BLCC-B13 TaxID=3025314 RepID=UPI00234EB35D|nr:tetratricopeptide repeat protein [Pseudomonas sp. BLCC-B13]MDC7827549.1 tetratricopeptide repeat protein [Pseudomonas sp. BLCC-B13]
MTSKPTPASIEWTLEGTLDEIARISETMKDRQFAFILGSGASFSSQIPTGKDFAVRWITDIHKRECTTSTSLSNWLKENPLGVPGITLENCAEFYPQIFERRFRGDRESGYAELENAMEGKTPSLGYSLLAEIIQHTRHKVVITTNFDNLVADSLAMHAHQSPLVVAHESLAGFVRPQLRRPLVAKIHRDLFYNPKNDQHGVSTMEEAWKIALKRLFQYFTPIVVGYGGNDGSLMGLLSALEPGDISGRMIWCYRNGSPPPQIAQDVLIKHSGIQVVIPGFDEFMLQLSSKLIPGFDITNIAERTARLGKERADRYRSQAENLQKQLTHSNADHKGSRSAIEKSLQNSKNWWAWELRAQAEESLEKRRDIYIQGISIFPESPELRLSYADFLADELLDNNAALAEYSYVIEKFPNFSKGKNNFAIFLMDAFGDHEKAQKLLKEAIELEPTNPNYLVNLANNLQGYTDEINEAEILYKSAFELDDRSNDTIISYSNFLFRRKDNIELAGRLLEKAISQSPNDAELISAYADFLADAKKDYQAAEANYLKAIELSPDSRLTLANYAVFLSEDLKDYHKAEEFYKKTIEKFPTYARAHCNYANLLSFKLGKNTEAKSLYEKAIELSPNNGYVLLKYAAYLEKNSKNDAAIRKAYERAVEKSEYEPDAMLSYAEYLSQNKKRYKEAEDLYKKTIELHPTSTIAKNSYAIFLANNTKSYREAIKLYEEILETENDPNSYANLCSVVIREQSEGYLARARELAETALKISTKNDQAVAEAAFYLCLASEIESKTPDLSTLAKLKRIIKTNYETGEWTFKDILDKTLPKIESDRHEFYKRLSDVILSPQDSLILEKFELWKSLPA